MFTSLLPQKQQKIINDLEEELKKEDLWPKIIKERNIVRNFCKKGSLKEIIHCIDEDYHLKQTKEHCKEAHFYISKLADKLNIPEEGKKYLEFAAIAHDIGKSIISDTLLTRDGKLTDDEYEIVKYHAIAGYFICVDNFHLNILMPTILYHHERYDGKGYPFGLKGKEIPKGARILSVVDSFSKMKKRNNMTLEQIKEEFRKESGKQFDPEVAFFMAHMLRE